MPLFRHHAQQPAGTAASGTHPVTIGTENSHLEHTFSVRCSYKSPDGAGTPPGRRIDLIGVGRHMDDISLERWLPVAGYEGCYEVSDLGRVRSLPRVTSDGRRIAGRILTLGHAKHGYPTANLWTDGRYRTRTVHALVAEAFIGPAPEGTEVRHLDGNPVHCVPSNLAYGTHAENMQDTLRHGTNDRAARTHCPQGHPYDAGNTAIGRRRNGSTFRVCRICSSEAKLRYQTKTASRSQEGQR